MMNSGEYRNATQLHLLIKDTTSWVEELCTLADIDRSANDLFDRLVPYVTLLGMDQTKCVERLTQQT